MVLGNAARDDDQFFGGFLSISLGYGLALMVGICVSGGVSGGHLNPAVTLAMAVLGKLKPVQVSRVVETMNMLSLYPDYPGSCVLGWAVPWGFYSSFGTLGGVCRCH